MSKRDWAPAEFRKLVVLGDSIAAGGWSTSREGCWVSRLATLINDFQWNPVQLLTRELAPSSSLPAVPAIPSVVSLLAANVWENTCWPNSPIS